MEGLAIAGCTEGLAIEGCTEGLHIAGCTAGLTSISGKFSATAGSVFLAPSVSIALLLDATIIPSSAGNQDSYYE